jgi:SulP family sulfate permease
MSQSTPGRSNKPNMLQRLLPISIWLPAYERSWLRADIMAGLAVWAMTIPQVLAYAGIAGVPPVYGLFAAPLAMLAYAIFGTSRTMSVGPESAIAIISAVTVGAVVVGGSTEFIARTAMLTLVVGVLFLVFGLLRLGWMANFLSKPVLQGFTQGIGLIVIVGQIPILFGTEQAFKELVGSYSGSVPTGFFFKAWAVVMTLGGTHLVTTVVGLGGLAILFAIKRFKPRAPSALIVVILSIVAVAVFGLENLGVNVIGEIESNMLTLRMPEINFGDMIAMLPGAFAIVLLGYSVSLSVASVGAQTTGEKIDPDQELVALGMANLGSSFSGGFVVSGSLSRGVVIQRAGGRNQLLCMINGGLIFLTLVFALPLFFRLPDATLAAVVIQAMMGLLSLKYFKRLRSIDRGELMVSLAALFGVLVLGILQGVALGVILALAFLIRRVAQPGSAVLGRLPGTDTYRDVAIHPEAEQREGIVIFRFDAPVIFANAGYLADQIRQAVACAKTPVRAVLLPAQQINHVDSTGADKLQNLHAELNAARTVLCFAEAKHELREAMRRTGLEEVIGADKFYDSIEVAVRAFDEDTAKG